MTEFKGTLGPWGLNQQGEIVTANGMNLSIALMYHSGFIDGVERKANARLIAAAPELLEALQGLVADYEWSARGKDLYAKEHPITLARAAIAKALGKDGAS